MSTADRVLELNIVDDTVVDVEGGAPAFILDIRGGTGFVPWFAAGAPTAQPCREDGTPLPGSQNNALTTATKVNMLSGFYLVTPDAVEPLTITKV